MTFDTLLQDQRGEYSWNISHIISLFKSFYIIISVHFIFVKKYRVNDVNRTWFASVKYGFRILGSAKGADNSGQYVFFPPSFSCGEETFYFILISGGKHDFFPSLLVGNWLRMQQIQGPVQATCFTPFFVSGQHFFPSLEVGNTFFAPPPLPFCECETNFPLLGSWQQILFVLLCELATCFPPSLWVGNLIYPFFCGGQLAENGGKKFKVRNKSSICATDRTLFIYKGYKRKQHKRIIFKNGNFVHAFWWGKNMKTELVFGQEKKSREDGEGYLRQESVWAVGNISFILTVGVTRSLALARLKVAR